MTKNNKKSSFGFSLIEVLIAVAIIGIIASIALPSYNNYIRKAQMTEGVQIMAAANKEIMMNVALTGVPPSTIQGVMADGNLRLGPEYKSVELLRYTANFDNAVQRGWFVVRYKEKIFPSSYTQRSKPHKREIHIHMIKNSKGEWRTKCGQYSGAFMSAKYLPSGCDETTVGYWRGDD